MVKFETYQTQIGATISDFICFVRTKFGRPKMHLLTAQCRKLTANIKSNISRKSTGWFLMNVQWYTNFGFGQHQQKFRSFKKRVFFLFFFNEVRDAASNSATNSVPNTCKSGETYWHDHSLESSRGAHSDGTISFWIRENEFLLKKPQSLKC
jgi:hypothetical protein